MIGYGVAATCFAGLGITLVVRRESGVLKRIRGDAAAAAPTYLVAVLASTFVVFLIEAVLIIALGRLLFSVALPERWLSLLAVLALGAALLRGARARRHRPRPLRRGLVGGDQRDLPADGDHLRARSSRRSPTPSSCACIAEILPLTHFTELTRDVMLHDQHIWSSLGDDRASSSPGARSASSARSAASAGSRVEA